MSEEKLTNGDATAAEAKTATMNGCAINKKSAETKPKEVRVWCDGW